MIVLLHMTTAVAVAPATPLPLPLALITGTHHWPSSLALAARWVLLPPPRLAGVARSNRYYLLLHCAANDESTRLSPASPSARSAAVGVDDEKEAIGLVLFVEPCTVMFMMKVRGEEI